MYRADSRKAEEFISHEEICATLDYVKEHKSVVEECKKIL